MAMTEIKDALKRAKNKNEYARIAAVNMVLNKNISADTVADGFCVSRGTVYAWLAAYERDGLDGLADDARPGRPPFVPRDKLKKIIGGAKRFTAYGFVELVEKRTGVKYSESHARRLLRSLGFTVKKTSRMADRVPSREELEMWQEDTEKEVETLENDGFTLVMEDESHQNSNLFGSGAVYVCGDAEPVRMPLGNQRQTVYGGITLDGETCYMAANRANDRSFIKYLDKLRRRFVKVAVILDNAAYHNTKRVRQYLEKNGDSVKLMFLPPYSPFLNAAEELWHQGKARIRLMFRRPARSYFRRKVMLVYESLEINFNPRNILFRSLDKLYPA